MGIPIGANAHVKFQSKKSFGAVLIARNPVEVTAYNDECLFKQWIAENKAQLYSRFGNQLKKYGLWIVTVTYTAPACSINAWMDKDKDAVLSAKAKAAMVGDLGAELDWTDKITDKDWCHYAAKPYKDAIEGAPAQPIVCSTAEATRLPGRRPLSKSSIPLHDASAIDPQLMNSTTPRRDTSNVSTHSSDVPPERFLLRKPAMSPVGNRIKISTLHSAMNYDLDPRSRNVQGTELSPIASVTEENGPLISRVGTSPSPTDQKSSPHRAASEGVVMFYNGLYTGPLEWWREGTRSAFCAFGSIRPGHDRIAGKVEQQVLRPNGPARYQQSARPQLSSESDETNEIHHEVAPHHPYGPYSDSETGYHPGKDEGVHPRYWPAKDPSLRATSNASNRRRFASQSYKGSKNSPRGINTRLDEKTSGF